MGDPIRPKWKRYMTDRERFVNYWHEISCNGRGSFVYNDILKRIYKNKIIAIIRGIGSDRILPTVEALLNGGISLLEVTYNHESNAVENDTLTSLLLITKEFGNDVCLGVGTVLTTKQVEDAIDSGVQYIISPNTDVSVIKKTKELGKISIPGAFTPSEMVLAYHAGADIVKLFPAGVLGTKYIKAVLSPLSHIPVVAVGGVDADNAAEFIKAGAIGVGVGGKLVDVKSIYAGEYDNITRTAREYLSKIKA